MPEYFAQIIMIVALFAIMYFMLIRPQKKKDDEVKKMRESLSVGDDVVTIGGIYGKVVRIREDRLTLQVGADKTRLEFAKWAVNNIENKSDAKGGKDAGYEEEKKVSPKTMKKLGEKKDAAEEPVEAAAEAAAETTDAEV